MTDPDTLGTLIIGDPPVGGFPSSVMDPGGGAYILTGEPPVGAIRGYDRTPIGG